MRRWRKRLWWLIPLLLAAVVGLWWLLASEAGLAWAWGRAVALSGGALSAQRVSGRLAGPLQIDTLQVRLSGARLSARRLELAWRPWALLGGRLQLQRVQVDGIDIELEGGGRAAPTALAPPLAVAVERLRLSDLVVRRPAAAPLSVDAVEGAGLWSGGHLQLTAAVVRGPWGRVTLDGRVATGPGHTSDLAVDWALSVDERPVAGTARLTGPFARPHLDARLTAPMAATVSAGADWPAAPLRWQADVTLSPLVLTTLTPDLPAATVAGQFHLDGIDTAFSVQGSGGANEARAGAWRFDGRLVRDAAGWQLPMLRLLPDGGSGEVSVSGGWPAGGEINLTAQWQKLQLPAAARWRSAGTLQLSGVPTAYRGTLAGALARGALPPGKVSADFTGNQRELRISGLRGEWLAGKWQGEGGLAWVDALRWQASLQASGVDPAQLDARWSGRLGGTLQAHGDGLRVERAELRLKGRLEDRPWQLQAAASGVAGQWQLHQLQLSSGSARLDAHGALGNQWALRLVLQAPQLGELWPGAGGALSLSGRLDGSGSAPRLRLDGEADAVAYGSSRLAQAILHTDIDLGGRSPWVFGLQLHDLDSARLQLAEALVGAGGTAARHELKLDARFAGGATLSTGAQGRWSAGRWQGELSGGRLVVPGLLRWSAPPARLDWSATGGELARWCWQGDGHACVEFAGRQGRWQGLLDVVGAPASLFERWLPRRDLALGGSVALRLAGTLEGGLIRQLQGHATLQDGTVAYLLPEGRVETRLQTARFDIDGDGSDTRAGFKLAIEQDGSVEGELGLPGWTPGIPLADAQRLTGHLDLETAQLEWLTYFIPALLRPSGKLRAHLHLAGTAGDPALSGELALQDGDVHLPGAGIHLQQVTINGRSTDGRQLELTGSARSGPGQLAVTGRLFGERLNRWRLEASLKGENFELVRLVQARALVSPDLQLTMEQGLVDIRGQLAVPQADINLPRLPDTVQVSPDEVIVDAPEQQSAVAPRRWLMKLDLRLVAGDRVRLEGYGFSGRLNGSVTLRGETPGLTRAQGVLNIYDGRYEAYGQNLVVQRGRLLFADSPPDNPALDVRAVRPLAQPDLVVGVEVGGRLKQPQLRLFSDPEMEQSEALSWLVLGRPLGSTTRGEADDLYRAAFAIGGERAARGVALQFGLDEVSVETSPTINRTTGATTTQSSVVLGKYLSPRLYLQYAVGLWDTANQLRLRYSLSSHWSLKMEQGEQSGADLVYTIER